MPSFRWWATGAVLATAFLMTEQPGSGQPPNPRPDRWRAWAVTAGPDTKLVVEGVFANGGPGMVVVVQPSVPQGINPKVLMLDVKAGMLPGVWPAIAYAVPANYTVSPYKAGTYTSVHLRYPDGSSIVLKDIIDAGAGPKFR